MNFKNWIKNKQINKQANKKNIDLLRIGNFDSFGQVIFWATSSNTIIVRNYVGKNENWIEH